MSKRRLGKNLEALLGITRPMSLPDVAIETKHETENLSVNEGVLALDVNLLTPGRYQPRRVMEPAELQSLADSIRTQGVIQPILVRKTDGRLYEIIAGERRFRAAQIAGLKTVPVVLKNVSDENAMVMALIENIQRENLNPLEEALALERLSKEFHLTHQEVAEAVGKSRTTVSNLLRLLTLPTTIKTYLEQSKLETGHAKVLLSLQGKKQLQAAEAVVEKGLSVRETEKLVSRFLDTDSSAKTNTKDTPAKDPDVERLETKLSEQLGAPVEILHHSSGKGRLTIKYHSLDELEGILAQIGD